MTTLNNYRQIIADNEHQYAAINQEIVSVGGFKNFHDAGKLARYDFLKKHRFPQTMFSVFINKKDGYSHIENPPFQIISPNQNYNRFHYFFVDFSNRNLGSSAIFATKEQAEIFVDFNKSNKDFRCFGISETIKLDEVAEKAKLVALLPTFNLTENEVIAYLSNPTYPRAENIKNFKTQTPYSWAELKDFFKNDK